MGAAGYLTGASNLMKRSRDSIIVEPVDDDAEVEDAGEKWKSRNELYAY